MAKAKKEGKKKRSGKSIKRVAKLVNHNHQMLLKFYEQIKINS